MMLDLLCKQNTVQVVHICYLNLTNVWHESAFNAALDLYQRPPLTPVHTPSDEYPAGVDPDLSLEKTPDPDPTLEKLYNSLYN